MRWMGACVAFALAMAPALLRAEDKGTTRTSGQGQTADKQPMSTAMPMTENDAGKVSKTSNAGTSNSASGETMTDARFVALMHHVNQEEIDAGKLAEKKGHSEAAKSFGKTLVSDHTRNDKDLLAAAKKAGIKPESSALTTTDKEQEKVDKEKMDQVKRMSAARFDKGFGQVMSNGHAHAIDLVRGAKGEIKSSDLKQYADSTLPVLEKHKDLADQLKGSESASKGENQGRTPASLRRGTSDTSSANSAGKNAEGNRGDDSTRSGAQNPDK